MPLITPIKDRIKSRVKTEKEKTTLTDQYGGLAFLLGPVLGKWVLGIISGVADALVLSSMFFLASRHWVGSIVAGITLSIVAQFAMGESLTRSVITFSRRDYDKGKGYKHMMYLSGGIVLVMLAATLYLSYNSGAVVEALTEKTLVIRDEVKTMQDQDAALTDLRKNYEAEKAELLAEQKRLEDDKVRTSKGMETRWQSFVAARKITNERIPALEEQYKKEREALISQKSTLFDRVAQNNDENKQKHHRYVSKTSQTVIYFNIGFNLLRCLLLIAYALFLVHAGNEVQLPARHTHTVAPTPHPAKVVQTIRTIPNNTPPVGPRPNGNNPEVNNEGRKQVKGFQNSVPTITVNVNGKPKEITYAEAGKYVSTYEGRIRRMKKAGKEPTSAQVEGLEKWMKIRGQLEEMKA